MIQERRKCTASATSSWALRSTNNVDASFWSEKEEEMVVTEMLWFIRKVCSRYTVWEGPIRNGIRADVLLG